LLIRKWTFISLTNWIYYSAVENWTPFPGSSCVLGRFSVCNYWIIIKVNLSFCTTAGAMFRSTCESGLRWFRWGAKHGRHFIKNKLGGTWKVIYGYYLKFLVLVNKYFPEQWCWFYKKVYKFTDCHVCRCTVYRFLVVPELKIVHLIRFNLCIYI